MTLPDELQVAYGLIQAQRVDEARKLLKQFTKRQSKHADGWFMLGQVERALQNWAEAIDALQNAAALEPNSWAVKEYLAMTRLFSNEGRQVILAIEDLASVLAAIPDAPGAAGVAANLQTLALRNDLHKAVIANIVPYFATHRIEGPERQRLAAGQAIAYFLTQQLDESANFTQQAMQLREFAYDADGKRLPGDYPFYHIYARFIADLIAFRAAHPELYEGPVQGAIHAIGESHSLTPSQLVINGQRVQSHLMMGCKAYMLANEQGESWQYHFKRIVQGLPKNEAVIAIFGEIDCRPGEGIMSQWAARADYAMEQEVSTLVAAYVKFVKLAQLKRLAPTYVCGVPAPHAAALADIPAGKTGEDLIRLIRQFNECLAAEADRQGLPFIDIYAATVGSDGWAHDGVHIDDVHLTPAVVAKAFTHTCATF